MINAKTIAKYFVKAFHNLYRESYLGQKIKHLLVIVESLLDEVDIHLGLSTRSHAMKKHHILPHHLKENLVVSFLLGYGKWFDLIEVALARGIQSSHLLFISKENLAVDERLDDGRSAMSLIHQLFLGDLLDAFARRIVL